MPNRFGLGYERVDFNNWNRRYMDYFQKALKKYKPLLERENKTVHKLNRISKLFQSDEFLKSIEVTIFIAGSIGRYEIGENSDLDIFFISDSKVSRLQEIKLFAHILDLNRRLKFPELSNDGQFLKIHELNKIKKDIGASTDDYMNYFTTRMLLLLESKPILNEICYKKSIDEIVSSYFRDGVGKKDFRPLFLTNDLLRFWRTLCLNYETIRNDPNKPWRKKNLNLKFCRLLTIYGTILPLVAKPIKDASAFKELLEHTPLQRLAIGLDYLKVDLAYKEEFIKFLECYECFLAAKEKDGLKIGAGVKRDLDEKANYISDYIYRALLNDSIDNKLRKYLLI